MDGTVYTVLTEAREQELLDGQLQQAEEQHYALRIGRSQVANRSYPSEAARQAAIAQYNIRLASLEQSMAELKVIRDGGVEIETPS